MTPLEVTGVGIVSSIGHNASQTCASIDAFVRRSRQTGLVGLDGRAIVASLVFPVDSRVPGENRAWALARPALRECLAEPQPPGAPRTALLLCAEPPLQQLPPGLEELLPVQPDWVEALTSKVVLEMSAHGLDVRHSAVFREGAVAGGLALQAASELLERGAVDQCLLGGIQSLGDRATLERRTAADLFRKPRPSRTAVPGEAATFLLLRRSTGASQARATIVGLGNSRGPTDEDVNGLDVALEDAIEASNESPCEIARIIADLDGDRRAAKALSVATLRTLSLRGASPALEHPADRLGCLDAATIPSFLAYAAKMPGTALQLIVAHDVGARATAVVLRNGLKGA